MAVNISDLANVHYSFMYDFETLNLHIRLEKVCIEANFYYQIFFCT